MLYLKMLFISHLSQAHGKYHEHNVVLKMLYLIFIVLFSVELTRKNIMERKKETLLINTSGLMIESIGTILKAVVTRKKGKTKLT